MSLEVLTARELGGPWAPAGRAGGPAASRPARGSSPPPLTVAVLGAAHGGSLEEVLCFLGDGGLVDARCDERDGDTILMAAAVGGAANVARKVLKLGASVDARNKEGLTALMGVSQIPSGPEAAAMVALLFKAGASPNLRSREGATALVHAVERSSEVELIEALLRGGCCPDVPKVCGGTALMSAAHLGAAATANALCRHGAAVDLRTSDNGATALMAAAQQGHASTVAVLLRAKADPSLCCPGPRARMMNAQQWAEAAGHAHVVRLIKQHAVEKAVCEAREAAEAHELAERQRAADAAMAELLGEEQPAASPRGGKGKARRRQQARGAAGSLSLDSALSAVWAEVEEEAEDSPRSFDGRRGERRSGPAPCYQPPPEVSGGVAKLVEDMKSAGATKEDRQAAAALLARRQQRQGQRRRDRMQERHTL